MDSPSTMDGKSDGHDISFEMQNTDDYELNNDTLSQE